MKEVDFQELYENFETTSLLGAVDHIDQARTHLGDGENWKPPQMRTDLLKLHGLAMDVINNGWTSKAKELFEMAFDIEDQLTDLMESIEQVYDVISKLTDLCPEELED